MKVRSTTILAVRRDGLVAIGGDGQVSLDQATVKHDARKIRKLADGKVVCGFAGGVADAFALLERFEAKLKGHPGNVRRAAIDLARDWRTDKILRQLHSLLVVVSSDTVLLISGSGDVIEPSDGIIGAGSGANFAVAAAKALFRYTDMPADKIVESSLNIAADICVYTNHDITLETLTATA
jgi:ATP-dependent HslUV protease subunit HslV